jgi:hypothetical protein
MESDKSHHAHIQKLLRELHNQGALSGSSLGEGFFFFFQTFIRMDENVSM